VHHVEDIPVSELIFTGPDMRVEEGGRPRFNNAEIERLVHYGCYIETSDPTSNYLYPS